MTKKRTGLQKPTPPSGRRDVEPSELDPAGLYDAICEIGSERRKILLALREALLSGDNDEALERARELTGLPSKRASHRYTPST